jgi:HPt (histidine-containing phosphotransfer) domain-containing protein
MADTKDDSAAVHKFGDHEVIMPPNKLRKAVSFAKAHEDPVERAEKALAQLSTEFGNWMQTECERLDKARQAIHAGGWTAQLRDDLFHAAHDIKGHAPTFGFPEAAGAADSLCRLIEHSPDLARIPLTLIDQHVEAVRAIIREYMNTDAAVVAAQLARRLREVADEFLLRENRHRPDYLDGIVGPSLAPRE